MASYDTNVKDIEVGTKMVTVRFHDYSMGAMIGIEWEVVKITKTRVVLEAKHAVDGSTMTKRLVVNQYGEIVFEEGRKESRYYDHSFYPVGSNTHLRALEQNRTREIRNDAKSAAEYFVGRPNDPAALNIAIEKMVAYQDYLKGIGANE